MADDVLRVLHVLGRMVRGGAELRTVELAESFGGERVRSDFLVLSGLDGPLDARVRAAGGAVIKCPLGPLFLLRLYRFLRAEQYDVVHSHVHYFSGVILATARLAGTRGRVAHFRTAVVNDKPDSMLRRAQLGVCRRLLRYAATDLLAVGEGAMHGAWSPRWRADSRCRVVYHGIPPERLQRVRVRPPDTPVIITVASVQPLKNQLRLVGVLGRCLRDLPDLELRLVGREVGDYGLRIRQAAARLGLANRVRFVGEVDDPLPWMAGSSLMILPSLWEGLPGAALEACALGIPVLAADLPGTRELAAHFPNLSILSLDQDDDVWAEAAVRLIRAGARPPDDAQACFAHSPFTASRAREFHYAIWSRTRATA
ncbi:MAG: glycosyltransferase [Acidobacteria bacterium]|nr:glycosyltransferase [Acidobacteriota bacterium]